MERATFAVGDMEYLDAVSDGVDDLWSVVHRLLWCQANFKQLDVVVVSSVCTEHKQRLPQVTLAT